MNLNKLVALTLCSLGLVVLSCKHEIPETAPGGGTGGGTGGGGGVVPPTVTCSADTVYFQQQVLPIFISNCAMSGCHDNASHQDGVVLTSYQSIMNTGDIEPGDPDDSEVYEKITEHDPSDRMPPPPRNPLTQAQINAIGTWIRQGARNNSCQASACDSVTVTYNNTIKPIIATKCQGCHSSSAPAGGFDFSQYSVLKNKALDGRLWGSVNHFPGFSPMPKNGNKLSTCELTQIRKWIDAGAPNN
jgi:mono/diheme cytochrome c family protein